MAQLLPAGLVPRRWRETEKPKAPTTDELLRAGGRAEAMSPERREGLRAEIALSQRREDAEAQLYEARQAAHREAESKRDDALYSQIRNR
jgi:hypothetical protein